MTPKVDPLAVRVKPNTAKINYSRFESVLVEG